MPLNGLMLITSWWLVVSYSNQTIDTRIKGLVRETMQLFKAWYSSSIHVIWDLLISKIRIHSSNKYQRWPPTYTIWMMFPSNVVYLENSTLHIFPGCDVRQENNIKVVFLAKISKKKSKTCEVPVWSLKLHHIILEEKWIPAIKLQQKRSNGL